MTKNYPSSEKFNIYFTFINLPLITNITLETSLSVIMSGQESNTSLKIEVINVRDDDDLNDDL